MEIKELKSDVLEKIKKYIDGLEKELPEIAREHLAYKEFSLRYDLIVNFIVFIISTISLYALIFHIESIVSYDAIFVTRVLGGIVGIMLFSGSGCCVLGNIKCLVRLKMKPKSIIFEYFLNR